MNKNNKKEYYLNKLQNRLRHNESKRQSEIDRIAAPAFVIDDDISFNVATMGIRIYRKMSFSELYTYTKRLWRETKLSGYEFPLIAITRNRFIIQGGWDFYNDGSIENITDGGWEVHDINNKVISQYTCIKTLGNVHSEQLSYSVDGALVQQFASLGQVNQAINTFRYGRRAKCVSVLSDHTYTSSEECGWSEVEPDVLYLPVHIVIDLHEN